MSLHFTRDNKPTPERVQAIQLIAESTADHLARHAPLPGSIA
jgi:hypothetical protein